MKTHELVLINFVYGYVTFPYKYRRNNYYRFWTFAESTDRKCKELNFTRRVLTKTQLK